MSALSCRIKPPSRRIENACPTQWSSLVKLI